MFCMLFRFLCCLCSRRHSLNQNQGEGYHTIYEDYDDDDDDDEEDDEDHGHTLDAQRNKLKRNAIYATVRASVAERLLARYGKNDSTLLMYYHECNEKMVRALAKVWQHKGPRDRKNLIALASL